MSGLRFGVLGAHPERVSRLGRLAIERLRASGAELAAWVEGGPEAPLPFGLDAPGPVANSRELPAVSAGSVDFLLQLDSSAPPLELFAAAPLGIWRFATPTPGPLAFWDVFDGLYHMEIRLDRLLPDSALRIPLDRRWIRVDRLSYRRTLARAIDEMARMPAHAAGSRLQSRSPAPFPPQSVQAPTAAQLAMLRLKLLARALGDQARGIFFSEAWQVGILEQPLSSFAELDVLPEVRWLPSPSFERYLADPFVARAPAGSGAPLWLLLAEDFAYSTGRGKIVQELSASGHFTGRMQDAIAEPVHMSHPFLLEYEGDLYCIPETYQKRGVYAWRWDAEARAWRDPRPIFTGETCVDPTPFFYANRWWLFFTERDDEPDERLHIYFSDSLWGPWHPHARNPVKTDIRSSRPGGAPFLYRGELYRPAQDSSKHYGWRLIVNRVVCLTPEDFEEEVIRVVDSDRIGVSGIHTISGAGNQTVIDARRWRPTPWLAPRRLADKIRKALGGR